MGVDVKLGCRPIDGCDKPSRLGIEYLYGISTLAGEETRTSIGLMPTAPWPGPKMRLQASRGPVIKLEIGSGR